MAGLIFISHPEVEIDPAVPIERWGLTSIGAARMRAFAASPAAAAIAEIWSSGETKAQDAAAILAARLGLPVSVEAKLGEIDRSATGFLPRDEFEATADAFFARPLHSVRGWERAADAQTRIGAAVRRIASHRRGGDLAIVSHGAVGTLLLCALSGEAIDRRHDQPFQGHYWRAKLPDFELEHGWYTIDPARRT